MKQLLLFFISFWQLAALAQPNGTRGIGTVEQTDVTMGTRRALIIGINKYKNISQLHYAANDAILLRDYLVNNPATKISDNNITLLIDSNATRARIFKELRQMMDISKANDEVLIYFAGHGDVDDQISSGFLLAYNCEATIYSGSDAVELSLLERHLQALAKKQVKVLLITDACRAGNLLGGMSGASTTMNSLNSLFANTTKILSCQGGELSKETDFAGGGHGVFTYYLVAGLYGMADGDNDGYVTLDELETYLKTEVRRQTLGKQHPVLDGNSNEQLAKVDAEAKAGMVAKMNKSSLSNGAGLAVASRGIGDDFVTTLDETGKALYTRFNDHVKNGALNGVGSDHAYGDYLAALKQAKNAGLQQYMRYELQAELEDATQEWLNYYLKGKIDDYRSNKLNSFADAADKIGIALTLLDVSDFSHNRLLANQYFFKALATYSTYTKGVYLQGVRYLEIADSILPNQSYINIVLGEYYMRIPLPNYEKANYHFQKAIQLNPKWSYPYINAAWLAMKLRDYDKALEYGQKTIDIDSMQKSAYTTMGWVYESKKQFQKAMDYFAKAYEIDSNDYQNLLNISMLYLDVNDEQNALAFLKKALKANPDKTDAYYNVGILYRKVQMLDDAVKYFQYCIDIDSTNTDAINGIGTIYFDKGEFAKSVGYFKKVMALDSTSEHGVGNVGLAYDMMGNYKEAKKYFLRVLSFDSNAPMANLGMASYYLSVGDMAMSQKYLNKHEPDQLNMGIYSYLLAHYWARAKDNIKAIASLEASFKNGYQNIRQVERDPDLAKVRELPAYRKLVEQYFGK